MRSTTKQENMLKALRERGMFLTAKFAEEQWLRGERAYLDMRLHGTGLRRKFEECNKQALEQNGRP